MNETDMVECLNKEKSELQARQAALRTEAQHLMDTIGRDGPSPGGRLLAERVGVIECELDGLNVSASTIDGQLRALQACREQVRQTVGILEMFGEAWAAFAHSERQDLVHLLVERIDVNEPAGKVDIRFHDLSAPFASEVTLAAAMPEAPAP